MSAHSTGLIPAGLLSSASVAVLALSLLISRGDTYAQSVLPSEASNPPTEDTLTEDTSTEDAAQGQVEVEVGRLDRWLDDPEAAEFESPSQFEPDGVSSPDQDTSGVYDDSSSNESAFGNQPTFELDIGVQQGPSDGDGNGGLSGEDGDSSSGDASAGDGSGTGQGASNGLDEDGAGRRDGSGSGSPSGTGDGSDVGNGRGTTEPGQGTPGGEGPVRTRRDYIPQVTGVIVDARQLDFLPSMSMRLFDPDGNQVYTTPSTNQQLNASQVAVNGTALFVTDEAQALELINRIGERPHTVVAQRTQGYDLVISNQDAWELRNQNQSDRFLETYSVVVIWQPRN
ncbi:MAG: hypothetical protein AAF268_09385 [Cyanobacteria bacterium P01_A01_bin.3]